MPGLSGLDLQRELRRMAYSVPIIFITAYPDERRREDALRAGAIGFLSKPFDERSLIDCLALAMGSHEAAPRHSNMPNALPALTVSGFLRLQCHNIVSTKVESLWVL